MGGARFDSSFSSENGGEQLERHFARVERVDLEPTARFADRDAAAAYLRTLGRDKLADRLRELHEPLVARGRTTVFVADA